MTPDQIADALLAGLDPVVDRLKALERQLAEVQKSALVYRGAYRRFAKW